MKMLMTAVAAVALIVVAPSRASAQCTEECGEVKQGGSFVGWICLQGHQGHDCNTTIEYCAITTTGCGNESFDELITDAEGNIKGVVARCPMTGQIIQATRIDPKTRTVVMRVSPALPSRVAAATAGSNATVSQERK